MVSLTSVSPKAFPILSTRCFVRALADIQWSRDILVTIAKNVWWRFNIVLFWWFLLNNSILLVCAYFWLLVHFWLRFIMIWDDFAYNVHITWYPLHCLGNIGIHTFLWPFNPCKQICHVPHVDVPHHSIVQLVPFCTTFSMEWRILAGTWMENGIIDLLSVILDHTGQWLLLQD